MKRLFGMALMGAIVFGMVWINAQANPPHMANTPDPNPKSKTGKMKWIYRHHVDDPNDLNGSLATMAQLWDVSPSDERPMVRGLLTFWRGVDAAGQYNDKHVYFLHPVDVTNGGEDNYKHESCTWTKAAPLDPTSTDPLIDVHASLFKAHGHGKSGKGTAERRLVIRFKYTRDAVRNAKKMGEKTGDCCDEEPDDDVLEEEDVTTPDPPDPC